MPVPEKVLLSFGQPRHPAVMQLHELGSRECLDVWLVQGPIPYLGDLALLSNVLLDSNQLTGGLPAWAASLDNITNLWLDNNNLSGPIPQVHTEHQRSCPSWVTQCHDSSGYCACGWRC